MDSKELNEALASNYMLVDVTIGTGPGIRTDKMATEELLHNKQAQHGAARVVKDLGNHPKIKEMKAMYASVRTLHYALSLAWTGSERIVATAAAMTTLKELSDRIRDADHFRDTVVAPDWNAICTEILQSQGSLAEPGLLPTAEQLGSKYFASVGIRPMPAISDFSRLNIPAPVADALANRMAKQAEAAADEALSELNTRLLKEVERMATQLGKQAAGEKTKLYDSLTGNLQRVVDLMRSMNLRGDVKQAELAERIENELLAHPVEVYRNNAGIAGTVAQRAKAIAAELQSPKTVEIETDGMFF